MSLATLKKKTASKYKNNSANLAQFSINGVHRNQGYVGQTSLGRTMLRTPAKGTESQGHGGCCGDYKTNDVQTSSINSTENNNYVKPSVLSTSGMLAKRNRWVNRPDPYGVTKPSDSNNQSTSGDYTVYKRKNAISGGVKCFMRKYILTFQYAPAINPNSGNVSAGIKLYINGKLMDSMSLNIDNNPPIVGKTYTYSLNGKLYDFAPSQQYIEREITFYESYGTLDINFEGSGTYWYRTGIAKLNLNGKSIMSSYRLHIDTVNSDQGLAPNRVTKYDYSFGYATVTDYAPSEDNPFIVINGYTPNSLEQTPKHRNQSESASFLGSEFPEILITSKTSIQGSKCCDKTVQKDYSLGAISQGDYIFQRIADCANLDISYIEYHTNPGSTFNTCS
jgi:hypothetical protein